MDEQLYLLAVGLSLEEKVEKAILNFQFYEREALKRDRENGYYLCDSYGKDSCVILDLAKRSGVKFVAHHNVTGMDAPPLMLFGRKHHPETILHRPKMHMMMMMMIKSNGPPTRLSRWCCEEYKEGAGRECIRVFGVRAEESYRRKAQWRLWTPDRKHDSFVLNPILYWTRGDVWEYIRRFKVPYCELYDEPGIERLGCVGCPMSGDGRKSQFKRFPKMQGVWEYGFKKFWTRWHGVPLEKETWVSMQGKYRLTPIEGERIEARFVPNRNRTEQGFWTFRRWYDLRGFTKWQDLWDWWMEENQPESEDDCQMGLF